jgi:hypothetical protein
MQVADEEGEFAEVSASVRGAEQTNAEQLEDDLQSLSVSGGKRKERPREISLSTHVMPDKEQAERGGKAPGGQRRKVKPKTEEPPPEWRADVEGL